MCNLPTCRSQDPSDCFECVHRDVLKNKELVPHISQQPKKNHCSCGADDGFGDKGCYCRPPDNEGFGD